jgi:hypothetical protein
MTTEEAKAIGEIAKTTGQAIDMVRAAGGWLQSVFGPLPEDLIGLAGADWVHEKRRRNLAQIQAKTAEFIAAVPSARLSEPSPSVVLPLLEYAANEGRPELQALWAALLANTMTDDGGRKIRRAFFEILAKMEPIDAAMLEEVAWVEIKGNVHPDWRARERFLARAAAKWKISANAIELTINVLIDLKCLQTREVVGSDDVFITPFGES